MIGGPEECAICGEDTDPATAQACEERHLEQARQDVREAEDQLRWIERVVRDARADRLAS